MHFSRLRCPILVMLAIVACLLPDVSAVAESAVRIEPAQGPLLRYTRPFRARNVPAVNLPIRRVSNP